LFISHRSSKLRRPHLFNHYRTISQQYSPKAIHRAVLFMRLLLFVFSVQTLPFTHPYPQTHSTLVTPSV